MWRIACVSDYYCVPLWNYFESEWIQKRTNSYVEFHFGCVCLIKFLVHIFIHISSKFFVIPILKSLKSLWWIILFYDVDILFVCLFVCLFLLFLIVCENGHLKHFDSRILSPENCIFVVKSWYIANYIRWWNRFEKRRFFSLVLK